MNIRRLLDSIATAISPPKSNGLRPTTGDFNPDQLYGEPDILGQSPYRLFFSGSVPIAQPSENYETALPIAKQFHSLVNQEERMAFWDAYPTVFGLASIIVFDTLKEEYWPYYGQDQDNLHSVLGREEGRYEDYSVLPADTEQFWPFADWCVQKYHSGGAYVSYTIISKETYWREISQHLFPEEFLGEELNKAETYRNRINGTQESWGHEYLTDEKAKEHFLRYGNKDTSRGGGLPFSLFVASKSILTCPLPTYGEIFFQYENGLHTARMVRFLRDQKKRLDNKEDIRFPASDTLNHPQTSEPEGIATKLQGGSQSKDVPYTPPLSIKQKTRPFPELLAGKYSEADLNLLLIDLRMRDNSGQNIWPQEKKAGLWGVIDALVFKNHLIKTTRTELMSSLSNYL